MQGIRLLAAAKQQILCHFMSLPPCHRGLRHSQTQEGRGQTFAHHVADGDIGSCYQSTTNAPFD